LAANPAKNNAAEGIARKRHCERSEAIQGGVHCLEAELDCFVASLLAMTDFRHLGDLRVVLKT